MCLLKNDGDNLKNIKNKEVNDKIDDEQKFLIIK